jgi:hypothetical protein
MARISRGVEQEARRFSRHLLDTVPLAVHSLLYDFHLEFANLVAEPLLVLEAYDQQLFNLLDFLVDH